MFLNGVDGEVDRIYFPLKNKYNPLNIFTFVSPKLTYGKTTPPLRNVTITRFEYISTPFV
jgi:hypothetical protein